MAIMQEDILKIGVRTRKRNKSIKESAKLVNLNVYLNISNNNINIDDTGVGEYAHDPDPCS